MKSINKVLFYADGAVGEKAALERAVEFARDAGAALTVMDVVRQVGTDDARLRRVISQIQNTIIEERRTELELLLSDLDAGDVGIRVVHGGKEFVSVIKNVIDNKFDLLIKSVNRRNAIGDTLFGSVDQRLMRQCPAPVWLIKPGQRRIRQVLAAVDLSSDDKGLASLARRVLSLAEAVASFEAAELHVLTVWDQPRHAVFKDQMDAKRYDALIASLKSELSARLDRLLKNTGNATVHLLQGEPDRAINRFAEKQQIDLIVMGTLSRSGIPGLLIGNTAERVLSKADCSVLTLKPKGFKTVIARA